MVKHWSVRCPSITLERQGAGSQSRVPGREAGWVQCGIASSSQSLQRNEPRGRRPKYTWRTGRQTPGGAHSQIMARSSPAHNCVGTRRDFTLPPPLPTEGLAYRSSERRVQGADAGLRGRLPAVGGGRGEGETSSAATRVLARAVSHGDLRELALPSSWACGTEAVGRSRPLCENKRRTGGPRGQEGGTAAERGSALWLQPGRGTGRRGQAGRAGDAGRWGRAPKRWASRFARGANIKYEQVISLMAVLSACTLHTRLLYSEMD